MKYYISIEPVLANGFLMRAPVENPDTDDTDLLRWSWELREVDLVINSKISSGPVKMSGIEKTVETAQSQAEKWADALTKKKSYLYEAQ